MGPDEELLDQPTGRMNLSPIPFSNINDIFMPSYSVANEIHASFSITLGENVLAYMLPYEDSSEVVAHGSIEAQNCAFRSRTFTMRGWSTGRTTYIQWQNSNGA
ncbi:Uncharacterized protein Fot_22733 [Forsythia ovata]|uniref:Uncharacterized protein n=1 Tax=Forsythia ovata TaxID=205694 RepID=A0ABD1UYK0_9LAMI